MSFSTSNLIQLHVGDNLDVLSTLAAGSVDAAITDPPYDVDLNPETCPWDVWPGPALWIELARVVKPDGLLAFTMAPHVAHERVPDVVSAGWSVLEVGFWVWGDGRPVNPHRPKRCFDLVYFMTKSRRQLYTHQARGKYRSNSRKGRIQGSMNFGVQYREARKPRMYQYGAADYHPANVACLDGATAFEPAPYARIFAVKRVRRPGADERHPTEKPLDLVAQIVNLVSQPGETVVDPCCGTGSFLEAAIALRRQGIGIDAVPKYVNQASGRLNNLQIGLGL